MGADDDDPAGGYWVRARDPAMVGVALSWAAGLDGSLARAPEASSERLLLSGPASLAMTHGLRAAHDAICVGRGTVAADDPRLTVRFAADGSPAAPATQPTAVVVDGALRTPPDCALLRQTATGRRVVIATAADGLGLPASGRRERDASWYAARAARRAALQGAGATILGIPGPSADLDLGAVLAALRDRCGVRSVFVEGGAAVLDGFLRRRDLVDEVVVTIAPCFVGGLRAPRAPLDDARLERVETAALGDDVVVRGRFPRGAPADAPSNDF